LLIVGALDDKKVSNGLGCWVWTSPLESQTSSPMLCDCPTN